MFSDSDYLQLIGNKAKGRISKQVFQENKAHQIFRKTNISYPPIRTRTHTQDFEQGFQQQKRVLSYF